MPDLTKPILLLHVLSAFAYVAGYVATNVLTEMARRNDALELRREALRFSTKFDRLLNAPGGTLVGITGLATMFAFGYSPLVPWVLAAITLFLVIVGMGILFWARVGGAVEHAMAAGDNETVNRVLRNKRNVAVSRFENVLIVVLIALMVPRPGS